MRMMRLHHRTSAGTAAGTAGMSEAAAANPTTFESELEAMFAAELHNMENLENLAENREATATATATATDDVDFHFHIPEQPQNGVVLPLGVPNMQRWSQSVYLAPKFKDEHLSYAEMIWLATKDSDTLKYVTWVQQRFRDALPVANKVGDFVLFLRAVNFNASSYGGVHRIYKDK